MKKAVFLTHPHSLQSEITGGVQLCSQEFVHVIQGIEEISLENYFIPYTKNFYQRFLIKMGMENYSHFNIRKEKKALLHFISDRAIDIVFINMASGVRFAKPIREKFGERVRIVLLSHGNHSGDFLHLLTKPIEKKWMLRKWLDRLRLGNLIATESDFRVRWLDGVVALSETEKQIENWYGAKLVSFLPRRLYSDFLELHPMPGRIGFVGRLDHPPNIQGLMLLLEAFSSLEKKPEFRVVGAPKKYGESLQKQFSFISYLGELSDRQLEEELCSWAFFTNPVWWYSTGSSTKLARAISWGLPIVTSPAGMRGYEWKAGSLLVAESPTSMAQLVMKEAWDLGQINYWMEQTRLVAASGLEEKTLSDRIRYTFQ